MITAGASAYSRTIDFERMGQIARACGAYLFVDMAHIAGLVAGVSNTKVGEIGTLNGLPQVWWPDHCIENTKGSEFHKDLLPVKNIVYKGNDPEVDSYSGFFDNNKVHKTKLDEILKENNIDTLYILGLATDYCVKFTVLDALSLGYKVYLVADGCKGVNINPDDSEKAVKEMKNAGAVIIKSCEIL